MNEFIDELINSFLKRYTTVSDLSDAETALRVLTLLAFTSTKVQILTHLADPPQAWMVANVAQIYAALGNSGMERRMTGPLDASVFVLLYW